MIQHIVLFQFRSEVPEEEIAAIVAEARALPAQIPEIRSYRVSFNMKGREEPYYVAVHSSPEALAHYGVTCITPQKGALDNNYCYGASIGLCCRLRTTLRS